jgi:hypothetical protein
MVIHTTVPSRSLEADISLLAIFWRPGVTDQPIVETSPSVSAIPNELHDMVDVDIGLRAAIEHTALIGMPVTGIDVDRHRSKSGDSIHHLRVRVSLEESVATCGHHTRHSRGPTVGCVTKTSAVGVSVTEPIGLWQVAIAPHLRETILREVVEGKLGGGAFTSSGPTAGVIVGHAGDKLLLTHLGEDASVDSNEGFDCFNSSVSPATAAVALARER